MLNGSHGSCRVTREIIVSCRVVFGSRLNGSLVVNGSCRVTRFASPR